MSSKKMLLFEQIIAVHQHHRQITTNALPTRGGHYRSNDECPLCKRFLENNCNGCIFKVFADNNHYGCHNLKRLLGQEHLKVYLTPSGAVFKSFSDWYQYLAVYDSFISTLLAIYPFLLLMMGEKTK
jgi:hypothetical protein